MGRSCPSVKKKGGGDPSCPLSREMQVGKKTRGSECIKKGIAAAEAEKPTEKTFNETEWQ